jgi:hypothetical protein
MKSAVFMLLTRLFSELSHVRNVLQRGGQRCQLLHLVRNLPSCDIRFTIRMGKAN